MAKTKGTYGSSIAVILSSVQRSVSDALLTQEEEKEGKLTSRTQRVPEALLCLPPTRPWFYQCFLDEDNCAPYDIAEFGDLPVQCTPLKTLSACKKAQLGLAGPSLHSFGENRWERGGRTCRVVLSAFRKWSATQ